MRVNNRTLVGSHPPHGKSKGQRIAPRIRTFTVPTSAPLPVISDTTVTRKCGFFGGCTNEAIGTRCPTHSQGLPPKAVGTSEAIHWNLPSEKKIQRERDRRS